MRLADIKKYLNTLLASFSSVLDLELTILQADPIGKDCGYRVVVCDRCCLL